MLLNVKELHYPSALQQAGAGSNTRTRIDLQEYYRSTKQTNNRSINTSNHNNKQMKKCVYRSMVCVPGAPPFFFFLSSSSSPQQQKHHAGRHDSAQPQQ